MMGKCVNAQPGTADMAIVVELHARPTADYLKSAGSGRNGRPIRRNIEAESLRVIRWKLAWLPSGVLVV